MQEDIRQHYEQAWKKLDDTAQQDESALAYSNAVEDAVLYPIYDRLLRDLKVTVNGGKVLDVGAGSGRWIRFFLQRFAPALLMGIDFTAASIDMLQRRYASAPGVKTAFRTADLTDPSFDLGEKFDLINVMNVLFHIPEPDRFAAAMRNLANHLAPGGRIVSTEYMPRTTMRTNCASPPSAPPALTPTIPWASTAPIPASASSSTTSVPA
jgi:SAM-dependent methyltransferase